MNVAICFYTPDSWTELKRVADDKKQLNDSYEEWLVGFTKAMTNLKEEGLDPYVLRVDMADLAKWCKARKLKNNSANRAIYASQKASELEM